jgi:cystathionine beta-synthase
LSLSSHPTSPTGTPAGTAPAHAPPSGAPDLALEGSVPGSPLTGTPRFLRPLDSIQEMVGWTPLLRLHRIGAGIRTPLYGKCEFMNPGGSVKDRIGEAIVAEAEARGALAPGGTIVEGTSGNTGIGLALAAISRGYRMIFTMPDKMSREKVKLLRAFGAEVVITPTAVAPDHPEHYGMKAKKIAEDTPGAVLADQFYNPANPEAHYRTTGPELWEQSSGRITHFVAGAGTGGTLTGTARYLKERNPGVKAVGVDPVGSIIGPYFHTGEMTEGEPYKVEGLGNDKIPGTLDLELVDDYRTVNDAEAFAMAIRLTREEGVFVGGSAGLNLHAAVELARELDDPDAFVVAVLCDWGERYLTKLWDPEWMESNGFVPRERRRAGELLVGKGGSEAANAPPSLVSVAPSTPVRMALSALTTHDVSQLPVLREGAPVGSVLEGELMSRVLQDPAALDLPVEAVMGPPFPVVDEATEVDELTRLLTRGNPAVLVRRGGVVSGILTRYDVVRTLAALR